MRHLGPPQRQEHGPGDPDAAGRARRRVRDLEQARPVRSDPRSVREQRGRVWNFDPEQVAAGEADWWWNPLSYVTSDRRALELTDAFVGAYRDPDARPDPFFDPAGQELVSHLLRAAALAERPVTQAFLWSTRPNDDEPARILARPRARARRRIGARPRPRAV